MKGKDGQEVECLIIPIEGNHLHKGEKGIYFDLMGFELKQQRTENNFTKTHLLKQNLPKAIYEALTEKQKEEAPIFGEISVYAGGSSNEPVAVDQGDVPFDDQLPF
jgi:hypothetical protein